MPPFESVGTRILPKEERRVKGNGGVGGKGGRFIPDRGEGSVQGNWLCFGRKSFRMTHVLPLV